jgi:hypothetical protein
MAALYYIWSQMPSNIFCGLLGPRGVPRSVELSWGMPCQHDFPVGDAYFEMNPRYKKQVALSDHLSNTSMAVISLRLKAAIEALEPRNIEFLPVEIRDHKGNPVKESYHIMNPTGIVDCLDKEQSVVDWNRINPDHISNVMKLVLRPEAIDPTLAFFRIKHMPTYIVARADVAEKLGAQGFTGFEFDPIDTWAS